MGRPDFSRILAMAGVRLQSVVRVLVVWLALFAGGLPASGQVVGDEITFQLTRFGVGGLARQGDWCGFEVVFRDQSESPREVVVEASFEDPDGDLVSYRRAVTSNPGLDQRVWLYGRLPYGFGSGDTVSVSIYEAGEPVPDRERARTGLSFGLGRALASARFSSEGAGRVQRYASSGLVIGTVPAGLRGYSERDPRLGGEYRAGAHELIEFGLDLVPSDLPDRWIGLSGFETVVWTDADPTVLTPERAATLRSWVERGGHLVIVLPADSQIWSGGAASASNALSELMPEVSIRRLEDASLEPMRGLLTSNREMQMPSGVSLYALEPDAGAGEREAMPILSMPDGSPVVVRRLVGTGMVSLVGMDLTSRRLRDRGLPETGRFWHRVLGQRGTVFGGTFPDQARTREAVVMDQVISQEINFEGSAARGVLIGVVLFAIYWTLAGPGGFGLLKKFGMTRHAWVAFAGACVLFTGIAWAAAGLLGESAVSARHMSVLDVVDGTKAQRSRTWASVLVPWYGDVTFGVSRGEGLDPGERGRSGTVGLSVWGPPAGLGATRASFPDNRSYGVSGREAETLSTPARSTVKQVQADYSGELLWSVPVAVGPEGGPGALELDLQGRPVGLVRHNMPGSMTRIQIAVIRDQRRIGTDLGTMPVFQGFVWKLNSQYEWAPGSVLDLGAAVAGAGGADQRTAMVDAGVDQHLFNITKRLSPSIPGQTVRGGMSAMLDSMFVQHLEPPVGDSASVVNRYAVREATHGLGMSAWFSQPCIIVSGLVETNEDSDDAIPTPLRVMRGGEWRELEGEGQTVVRWIYPLAPSVPGYFGTGLALPEDDEGAPASTGGDDAQDGAGDGAGDGDDETGSASGA